MGRIHLEFRKKGELPYNIRRPFIEELLDRQECLCGRTLDSGCVAPDRGAEILAAVERLNSELARTDFSEIQNDLFGSTVEMRSVVETRGSLASTIASCDNRISDAHGYITDLEKKLDEVKAKLEGVADVDGKALLLHRREALEKSRIETIGVLALRQQAINEVAKNLEDLRAQRAALVLTTDAGRTAFARADLCRQVASAMEGFRELERKIVRSTMEKRLRGIFRSYSITGYSPRVAENYALSLHKKIGDSEELVADSTGEGQALSLAFITTVTLLAMQRTGDRTFPIIIDSQFGSLDRNYHRRIAEILPSSVSQVVMIQTKTQWTDEMRSAMRPFVGQEVVLTRRVVTDQQTIAEDGRSIDVTETVELDNGNWPYVELGESDSTRIHQMR